MRLFRDIVALIQKGGILFAVYCVMLYTSMDTNNIYCIAPFCLLTLAIVPVLRYWDKLASALGLFSVFYCLIVFFNNGISSGFVFGSYFIAPVSFYLFGKYIVDRYHSQDLLFTFLLFSIILFAANLYYDTIIDIATNGFLNVSRELAIGDNDKVMSATLYGLNVSLGISGVTAFFMWTRFSYKWVILVSLLALSITTVLHLVNRTGLVIAVLCLIGTGVCYSKKNIWRLVIPLFLCIGTLSLLIDYNVIDNAVFNVYEARADMEDNVATAGGRTSRWLDAVAKMWKYPFGWFQDMMTFNGYVHNLWLDIVRVAGLLPFICFFAATYFSIKSIFKLAIKASGNSLFLFIVGLNICFFTSSFVEPVIEGFPLYLYLFLMLWGIQYQVLIQDTKKILNNT